MNLSYHVNSMSTSCPSLHPFVRGAMSATPSGVGEMGTRLKMSTISADVFDDSRVDGKVEQSNVVFAVDGLDFELFAGEDIGMSDSWSVLPPPPFSSIGRTLSIAAASHFRLFPSSSSSSSSIWCLSRPLDIDLPNIAWFSTSTEVVSTRLGDSTDDDGDENVPRLPLSTRISSSSSLMGVAGRPTADVAAEDCREGIQGLCHLLPYLACLM
jgi:hypothetical protein